MDQFVDFGLLGSFASWIKAGGLLQKGACTARYVGASLPATVLKEALLALELLFGSWHVSSRWEAGPSSRAKQCVD